MTDLVAEMRESIIRLGGERSWFETRQAWLDRAARIAGISARSAKALFYRETPDPKASVVERVRCAVEKLNDVEEAKARDEFKQINTRIAELERQLDTLREGPIGTQAGLAGE
jgi:hypothetical protein